MGISKFSVNFWGQIDLILLKMIFSSECQIRSTFVKMCLNFDGFDPKKTYWISSDSLKNSTTLTILQWVLSLFWKRSSNSTRQSQLNYHTSTLGLNFLTTALTRIIHAEKTKKQEGFSLLACKNALQILGHTLKFYFLCKFLMQGTWILAW